MTRQQAIKARRDELLTVKEFAYLFRVDPLSVYRRIRRGTMKGVVRLGREIRIDFAQAVVHDPVEKPSQTRRVQTV